MPSYMHTIRVHPTPLRMQLGWFTYRQQGMAMTDSPVPNCNPMINFDSIAAPSDQFGVALQNGFAGLDWAGWTVVNAAQAAAAVSLSIANNNAPQTEIDDDAHALYAIGWVHPVLPLFLVDCGIRVGAPATM